MPAQTSIPSRNAPRRIPLQTTGERAELVRRGTAVFVELQTLLTERHAHSNETPEAMHQGAAVPRYASYGEVREASSAFRATMVAYAEAVTAIGGGDAALLDFRRCLKYWYFAECVCLHGWGARGHESPAAKRPRAPPGPPPQTLVEALQLWLKRYGTAFRALQASLPGVTASLPAAAGEPAYWAAVRRLVLYGETSRAATLLLAGVQPAAEQRAPALARAAQYMQRIAALLRAMPRAPGADGAGAFKRAWAEWAQSCRLSAQTYPRELLDAELHEVLLILAGDSAAIGRHTENWVEHLAALALFTDPLAAPDSLAAMIPAFPDLVARIDRESSRGAPAAVPDPILAWDAETSRALYRVLTLDLLALVPTLVALDEWAASQLAFLLALVHPEQFQAAPEAREKPADGDAEGLSLAECMLLSQTESLVACEATRESALAVLAALLRDATRPVGAQKRLAGLYAQLVARVAAPDEAAVRQIVRLCQPFGIDSVAAGVARATAQRMLVEQRAPVRAAQCLVAAAWTPETGAALDAVADVWLSRLIVAQAQAALSEVGEAKWPTAAGDLEALEALCAEAAAEKRCRWALPVLERMRALADYHSHRDAFLGERVESEHVPARVHVLLARAAQALFAAIATPRLPPWACPTLLLEMVGYLDGAALRAKGVAAAPDAVLMVKQALDVLYFAQEWAAVVGRHRLALPFDPLRRDLYDCKLIVDPWTPSVSRSVTAEQLCGAGSWAGPTVTVSGTTSSGRFCSVEQLLDRIRRTCLDAVARGDEPSLVA